MSNPECGPVPSVKLSRDIVPLTKSVLFCWALTEDACVHAATFAGEMVAEKQGHYEDTNQDEETVRRDCFIGKVGERAVHAWLQSLGLPAETPEGMVPGRRKFTPDLTHNIHGVPHTLHIKTQTTRSERQNWQTAWVWQAGSKKGRRDPLLDHWTPQDFMVGCTFDEQELMVYIRVCEPLDFLHQHGLFVKTKLKLKHIENKLLIRLIDIIDNKEAVKL